MDGKINSAAWFDYDPRVIGTPCDSSRTPPLIASIPSPPPSLVASPFFFAPFLLRPLSFVRFLLRIGSKNCWSQPCSEGWLAERFPTIRRRRRRMLIRGVNSYVREARLRGALFSRGMLEISSERENLIAWTPLVIESCVRSSAIRRGYVYCDG